MFVDCWTTVDLFADCFLTLVTHHEVEMAKRSSLPWRRRAVGNETNADTCLAGPNTMLPARHRSRRMT